MTEKMTVTQAAEAIRALTTADEIAAVLKNCTKSGISEAFRAVTGEKAYPQSWNKEVLVERSARRIAEHKEAEKFLAMDVMEKVGYLGVATSLSFSAPLEKCSLYELFVIVRELGVKYEAFEERIKGVIDSCVNPVSSRVLAYYLMERITWQIRDKMDKRRISAKRKAVQPAGYDPRTATIAESIKYGRTQIPQTGYALGQYDLGVMMMRNFLLGKAKFSEITDWEHRSKIFVQGMSAHLGVPEITHEGYSDEMKELAMHDVITGTVDLLVSGRRQIKDYLTEDEQSKNAEYLAGNPKLKLSDEEKAEPTTELQEQQTQDTPKTQTQEEKVNEAMETVAVMTSAGDNNDVTRYTVMTKVLRKYTLAVLKEVAARNNFSFKAYRLNKEEYAQELSDEIIRLLDFIDSGGRENHVTPIGAMRQEFLDGKMTYVESDVRDKKVMELFEELWKGRTDGESMLMIASCKRLYELITCTPESHAFQHLPEEQLRVMIGFRSRYNDRGIDSGMSIKSDLNAVEVRDSELAGRCFAEYVRQKFGRELEVIADETGYELRKTA